MDPRLQVALVALADVLEPCREDWWILGSTAVALHGADPGRVNDIDVLLSESDARLIFPRLCLPLQPGSADAQFSSRLFGTWRAISPPVEFMAGLHRKQGDRWIAFQPETRIAIAVGGAHVFVPERSELEAILQLFDRPKDHARLAALRALD